MKQEAKKEVISFTIKNSKNFELSLEWKISKGGNSGIFYLGEEKLDYIWKTAPEMQVLDNVNHPGCEVGKRWQPYGRFFI